MSRQKWDENDKSNRFCFVSHMPEQRKELKEAVKGFPFWAWIDHQPEDTKEDEAEHKEHTHFMIKIKGTNSIKSIAKTLGLPSHMVQICWIERSYGRYFLHLDDPKKTQYKVSLVHTNKPSRFEVWMADNQDDDAKRLYNDICHLRSGSITKNDFINAHYIEIQGMSFFQKFNFFINL